MSKRKAPLDYILIKEKKMGLSGKDIANKYKMSKVCVCRHLKRLGISSKSPIGLKGKEHSQWKGGRGLKSGYWTIYNPEHPRALNNGRVWEHIVLLEKALNREIKKGEPIHHINLDRQDNKLSNLYLCSNHKIHQGVHNSLDEVVSILIKNKVIGFSCGKYFLL